MEKINFRESFCQEERDAIPWETRQHTIIGGDHDSVYHKRYNSVQFTV